MSDAQGPLDEGLRLLEEGDHRGAAEALEQAVAADPEHGQAWFALGCARGELDEVDAAAEAYERSADVAGPKAGLPLFNLGKLLERQQRFRDAADAYHRAVKADPAMADAWINLGRILDDSGQHAVAVNCYDNALVTNPDDAVALANRGNSLRSLGHADQALESYRRALAVDPEDLAARVGLGCSLVESGEDVEAGVAALRTACQQSNHPLAWMELATALARTKRYEAAVKYFDTAIELGLSVPELWSNRAECLWRLGETELAVENFDLALSLDAGFKPALFGKARTLAHAERMDEARQATRQYLAAIDDDERQAPPVQALLKAVGEME